MAYQQYPPQAGYPPQQQPGYPPQQQQGYPPQQQQGYPPQQQQGYPPQQPGYGAPQPGYPAPQPGYAQAPVYAQPQVMMQPQVIMQPAVVQQTMVVRGGGRGANQVVAAGAGSIRGMHHGARIHLQNQKHGKHLRIGGGGQLDCSGGHGRQATFTVEQQGPYYKLRSGSGFYVALKHGQACSGSGGQHCLLLIKQQRDGDIVIRSKDDSMGVAFPQPQMAKPAHNVGMGKPAQFDIIPYTGF